MIFERKKYLDELIADVETVFLLYSLRRGATCRRICGGDSLLDTHEECRCVCVRLKLSFPVK